MDIEHIKILLEKYYSGTSTLEEERMLSAFFTSGAEIPMEMEADRKVFELLALDSGQLDETPDIELPEGLEIRMEHVIDGLSAKYNLKYSRKWRLRLWGGAIAAMMVISAGITAYRYASTQQPVATITDEQAINYTEKSLNLLLNTVRRGTSESVKAQETLASTTSTALKNIENL